jgi:hypothetical protein
VGERWTVTTKPGAELTKIDPEPVPRSDGATWQRFKTAHSVTFAQVIEANGRVMWLQLQKS